MSDLEKEIHKFAYECATKGVDIEETINSITKNYGEIINAIIKLEGKNYNYLLKFAKNKVKEEGKEK